jgi:hypothetical protein
VSREKSENPEVRPMSVMHRWTILGVVVSLVFPVACGDGGAAKIKEIQKQADDRIAQADRVAQAKISAAQQQMDATKAQLEAALAKAKTDADTAIAEAKASADQEEKAAEVALTKARDAYKAEARVKLADLNRDTRDVAIKAAKVPAKAKALVDKAMKDVLKEQQQVGKDISAFDAATLDTFKTTKAKLDQDLAKLKAYIQVARSRVL